MKVGLDTHRHEAGECYTRKIADHWADGQNCGDPRCEYAHYLANFDYSDADIHPLSLEHWTRAKWNSEKQGRIHAEATIHFDA